VMQFDRFRIISDKWWTSLGGFTFQHQADKKKQP